MAEKIMGAMDREKTERGIPCLCQVTVCNLSLTAHPNNHRTYHTPEVTDISHYPTYYTIQKNYWVSHTLCVYIIHIPYKYTIQKITKSFITPCIYDISHTIQLKKSLYLSYSLCIYDIDILLNNSTNHSLSTYNTPLEYDISHYIQLKESQSLYIILP